MNDVTVISAFVSYQQARSLSSATIERRLSSIGGFTRFLEPLPILDATASDIDEWVATLRSPRTKHAYRSDLAAFYGWALKRRLITENPVVLTDSVRVPRGLPRPVPPSAVVMLLDAAPPVLRVALALAAYAGLRRSEIVRLTTDDVMLGDNDRLVVRGGKGSKDRTVPVHPVLAEVLADRRPSGARYVPMTPKALGQAAAAHLRMYGFDCTLHQLRHTFGTEAARAWDGNLLVVADLMGHATINTTLGYAALVQQVDRERLASMFSSTLRSVS